MDTTPKKSAEQSHSHIIRCTEVPQELLADKSKCRRYFKSFGRLKAISFKPKIQTCLVEFATEEGVLNALEIAGEYEGKSFRVERHNMALLKKKKEKVKDPEWTVDPEVRAELEAMGTNLPREYNLRPEAMIVDPPISAPPPVKPAKLRTKPTKLQSQSHKFDQENSSLLSILKQSAFSIDSKYKVLDARDKLLKLRLKSRHENKSDATIGTCPDMCPEKERLLRVIQHQVALYEQNDDRSLDPKLAVKQYSRSSADQDAPLPHELRPVQVLGMTMGYLMHRIMGLCDTPDVNIAEWYHFLWDRTRGIRKDITQQALCCHGSVQLVEQCARFHIFCSARLVAEDPSTFDQRINTENLTKCLQTLKYMYHDLRLKGVDCANEAEFRAYIILLNLNDGNFMWEVQQLSTSIQRSNQIKFALDVYSSLDKNNYVKFFKLVRSTSFLNACILMRYFVQVRLCALDTLLKCYSPRGTLTSLRLSDFTDILGFESAESALDFLECHGMSFNSHRTHLILDRSKFSEPEYAYVLDRATSLVESKREASVGEIVCGGPLPVLIQDGHRIQDSFDDRGFLKLDDFLTDELLDVVANESENVDEQEQEVSNVFRNEDEVDDARDSSPPPMTVTAVKVDQTPPDTNLTFAANQSPEKVFTQIPQFIFNVAPPEVTVFKQYPLPSLQRPVNLPPIDYEEENRVRMQEEDRKRQLEEEIRIKERLEHLERLKKDLEEKQKRLEELKAFEKSERERKLREEQIRLDEEREKLKTRLEIESAVTGVISHLLQVTEKSIKVETLARISDKIEKRRARKALNQWRAQIRLKRKRKATDFSPVTFGSSDLTTEVAELKLSSQDLALEFMKRYKSGSPINLKTKPSRIINGKVDFFDDTCDLITQRLLEFTRQLPTEIYWKVTFSLPSNGRIENALDKFMSWKIDRNHRSSGIFASYYFEKVTGAVISSRCDSDGYIFIGEDLDHNLMERIASNFKNCGLFAKKPLVLILSKYDENKSKLNVLKREGIISDYLILVDTINSDNLVGMVKEALIYLASKVEKPPDLEMDSLKAFLTKYLVTDLWKKASSFAKWNSNYEECLKSPNTLIYLHNECLDRLKSILIDESLREYPKFPDVFKSQLTFTSFPCCYRYFPNYSVERSYLKHVASILNSLYLPKIHTWPPKSQAEMHELLFDYCGRVYAKDGDKVVYKMAGALSRDFDLESDFDQTRNVIWIELVEILSLELIEETDFSLYGTGFVHQSDYKELVAVYRVEALKEFTNSDWFYVNHPIIKATISSLIMDEKNKKAPPRKEPDLVDFDLDRTLKVLARQRRDFKPIQDQLDQCKALVEDLDDTYAVHREILRKSGKILENIVKDA